MALLEAQASGLAVVAGRVRGVPGIVRHGESGLLVPQDGDFAEALGRLIDDRALRVHLGGSAAATVAADHGLEAAAATLDRALAMAAS